MLIKILLGENILEDQGIDPPHPNTPKEALIDAFKSGNAKLTTGSLEDFQKFFSYFDPLNKEPVPITIK